MKSHEEFLQEVYEKADFMKTQATKENRHPREYAYVIRYGAFAAALIAVFIMLMTHADVTKPVATGTQTHGTYLIDIPAASQTENLEHLVEKSTDILEVTKTGDGDYIRNQVLRKNNKWDKIESLLEQKHVMKNGESAIVFIDSDVTDLSIIEVCIEREDTFVIKSGELFTMEILEDIVE